MGNWLTRLKSKLRKSLIVYRHKIIGILLNFKSPNELRELLIWSDQQFKVPAPHTVKMKILKQWGGQKTWIETGTHKGGTSKYLASYAEHVFTLEPSKFFFDYSVNELKPFKNVRILHGTSQEFLNDILAEIVNTKINSDVCFWLDGHFSGGATFQGNEDTAILSELEVISGWLSRLSTLTIFIDDARLFRIDKKMEQTYPDLFELAKWAQSRSLFWTIECDIFIITNRKLE